MAKVEKDTGLTVLRNQIEFMQTKPDYDRVALKELQKELEVMRAKLQARARFAISAAGPGAAALVLHRYSFTSPSFVSLLTVRPYTFRRPFVQCAVIMHTYTLSDRRGW